MKLFAVLLFKFQNCVDAISDRISDQIGVIAGVSIAFAVILVSYIVKLCYGCQEEIQFFLSPCNDDISTI